MATTIKDLFEYVQKHPKRNEVWRDWTDAQLVASFAEAAKENALGWCKNEEGNFCGIVVGKPNYDKQILHITGIIADSNLILARFLLLFNQQYGANWRLSGNRNGKLKIYSTKKLCSIAISQTH